MPTVTDLTARYSGMLAYNDNTTGYFHVGVNGLDGTPYSVDTTGSHQTQINISWSDSPAMTYYVHQAAVWAHTNLFSTVDMVTTEITPTKTPSGAMFAVFHLEIVLAFDDNTSVPISITFENDNIHDHVLPTIPTIDNAAAVFAKLSEMLQLMLQTVTLS